MFILIGYSSQECTHIYWVNEIVSHISSLQNLQSPISKNIQLKKDMQFRMQKHIIVQLGNPLRKDKRDIFHGDHKHQITHSNRKLIRNMSGFLDAWLMIYGGLIRKENILILVRPASFITTMIGAVPTDNKSTRLHLQTTCKHIPLWVAHGNVILKLLGFENWS